MLGESTVVLRAVRYRRCSSVLHGGTGSRGQVVGHTSSFSTTRGGGEGRAGARARCVCVVCACFDRREPDCVDAVRRPCCLFEITIINSAAIIDLFLLRIFYVCVHYTFTHISTHTYDTIHAIIFRATLISR